MISPEIYNFLKDLCANNNKEWFNENRKRYELAKKEFEIFVSDFIPELAKVDKEIKDENPKQCIFRIFRDVRFSKDKTPYKTNFGAYIVNGGRKSGNAGYYIHIEPDNSFIGGGIYMPPSDNLKAIRTAIYNNSKEFKKIISDKSFTGDFGEIYGEKLVNAPRGFDKDFKEVELIKFKSYAAIKTITDKAILSKNFNENCLDSFKKLKPLNNFLNGAL